MTPDVSPTWPTHLTPASSDADGGFLPNWGLLGEADREELLAKQAWRRRIQLYNQIIYEVHWPEVCCCFTYVNVLGPLGCICFCPGNKQHARWRNHLRLRFVLFFWESHKTTGCGSEETERTQLATFLLPCDKLKVPPPQFPCPANPYNEGNCLIMK